MSTGTEVQSFRAALDALDTAPDPRDVHYRAVADAAGRLAGQFPSWTVTVEQCWHGYALHAVARDGTAWPGLYAVVTESEEEMSAILGQQPVMPAAGRAAAAVRRAIADGTLRPGDLAPSAPALAAATGVCEANGRRALLMLLADGTLVRGAGPRTRPRVPGAPAARDPRPAALIGWREKAGMTQRQLAVRIGMSPSAVVKAETGRLGPGRRFWELADAALSARGELLAVHDRHIAARTRM